MSVGASRPRRCPDEGELRYRSAVGDRERAMQALARWKAARAWARADPSALSVSNVEPVGPVQVALTSVFEARGVRYTLRPAPSRATVDEPGPDPWAVDLTHPPDAPVGHEVGEEVPGVSVHMDCGLCSAMGDMTCPRCDGMGRIQRGKRSEHCYHCGGRGQLQCEQCKGSGGLYGYPRVWSRIEERTVRRVHEADGLPNDVFLALSDDDHGGEPMHEQAGERIVDLVGDGSYRDAARSNDPLRQLVQKLCANPDVPDEARLLRQSLRLSRVAAWEITLEGGERLWVYGEPPRVSPPAALPSTALRVAKLAPLVAVGAAGVAAAFWLLG